MKTRAIGLSTFLVASTALAITTGCSGGGGSSTSSPTPTNSATPTPSGAVPDPIVLSGTTQTDGVSGSTPVTNATVEVYRTGTATALIAGSSDGTGHYSLNVPTGGAAVDGYIHAAAASYLDSYQYPTSPFAASATFTVTLLNSSTFGTIGSLAGVTQASGKGWIAVEVVNSAGTPTSGATVSTTPSGTVKYLSGGLPSSSATMTDTDGVAFVFNLTPGDVIVSASAGGNPLHSHTVNARADVLTYTSIAP